MLKVTWDLLPVKILQRECFYNGYLLHASTQNDLYCVTYSHRATIIYAGDRWHVLTERHPGSPWTQGEQRDIKFLSRLLPEPASVSSLTAGLILSMPYADFIAARVLGKIGPDGILNRRK